MRAARLIDECSTPSLLVRAPILTDGPECAYLIHRPGERIHGSQASRATAARFVAGAVEGAIPLDGNESLGVTEAERGLFGR